MQKATIHQSHVYWWIKISRTIFEKGHSRNNPVKLFQILISSFWGEKFWRISVSPECKKSPPPPTAAMFINGSKFHEQFLKRVTQGTILCNYFKIVSEKKMFKEFLHVGTVQKVSPPPPPAAMCLDGSKFHEHFLKRDTIMRNYFKIGPGVSEEKIFKEFLKKFHLVAMATRIFDGIKFCE